MKNDFIRDISPDRVFQAITQLVDVSILTQEVIIRLPTLGHNPMDLEIQYLFKAPLRMHVCELAHKSLVRNLG